MQVLVEEATAQGHEYNRHESITMTSMMPGTQQTLSTHETNSLINSQIDKSPDNPDQKYIIDCINFQEGLDMLNAMTIFHSLTTKLKLGE